MIKTKKENIYFLHFIGKGLYSIDDFEKESAQYGVNRCIPINILKKIKLGDNILLAQHQDDKAVVFGYFTLSGINFENQNHKGFVEQLESKLQIKRKTDEPISVTRQCGSYVILSKAIVGEPIDKIIEKALKISESNGVRLKAFASGLFTRIADKEISPIKFSRSGVYINLDLPIESDSLKDVEIGFLGDYKSRKYFLKYESVLQQDFFAWFEAVSNPA